MEQYTLILPPSPCVCAAMIRAIFLFKYATNDEEAQLIIMVWLFNESSEESRSFGSFD